MKKKLLNILLAISALFMLVACTESVPTLPNLWGMTKVEVINTLSNYDINVSFNDVYTNEVDEGKFVSYEGYNVGDKITVDMDVVVNFAINYNILPDLTGLNELQIYAAFSGMELIISVEELATNDVAEGLFVEYGNMKAIGDNVIDGETIVVYVAVELIIADRSMMISKYVEGRLTNKAIELFNTSNEDIDLSNYYLAIYENGSETSTTSIPLSGTLGSKETFLIASTNSDTTLLSLADATSDDLLFDGNDAIALTYYNDEIVDVVGRIGFGLSGFSNRTLVRDELIEEPSATFINSDWNIYVADYLEPLGTHPVTYPSTFTYLTSDTLIPYDADHPRGMVLVEYGYANDGDTSTFTPGFEGSDRVRFVGIDTTESGSGTLATQATSYLRGILNNATEIYIQYDPSAGFKDTYERHLGLVWADGQLVNYLMVLRGYSQNNYYDEDETFVYEGITLNQWFENAENYAQENQLGVWS